MVAKYWANSRPRGVREEDAAKVWGCPQTSPFAKGCGSAPLPGYWGLSPPAHGCRVLPCQGSCTTEQSTGPWGHVSRPCNFGLDLIQSIRANSRIVSHNCDLAGGQEAMAIPRSACANS